MTNDEWMALNEQVVIAASAERDSLVTQLEQMRRERDEALRDLDETRALNTRIHGRAQAAEALYERVCRTERAADRKASPPLTIRSHARARRPLDGADAQALEGAITLTERERDEARAKLLVIHDTIVMRHAALQTADETCRTVLRIIDEKGGGQ